MVAPEELRFARLVIAEGWLSKQAVEEALREVARLRRGIPTLTLREFLAGKKLLSSDRIEAAWDRANGEGENAPAAPSPETEQAFAQPWHGSSGAPPLRARRVRPDAGRRHATRSATKAPLAIAGCALLGVVVLAFLLRPGKEQTKGPSPAPAIEKRTRTVSRAAGDTGAKQTLPAASPATGSSGRPVAPGDAGAAPGAADTEDALWEQVRAAAAEPARQRELVAAFLIRFSASARRGDAERLAAAIESRARAQFDRLKKEQAPLADRKKFRDAIVAYRAFAVTWAGVDAAAEAAKEIATLNEAWRRAGERALDRVTTLLRDGKDAPAYSALVELRAWCDDGIRASVDAQIVAIERGEENVETGPPPEPEIAVAPKKGLIDGLEGSALEEEQEKVGEELARLDREAEKEIEKRRAKNLVPWKPTDDFVIELEARKKIGATAENDPERRIAIAKMLLAAKPPFEILGFGVAAHEANYLVRLTLEAKPLGETKFYGTVPVSRSWEGRGTLEVLKPGSNKVLYRLDTGALKESFPKHVKGEEFVVPRAMDRLTERLRGARGWRLSGT